MKTVTSDPTQNCTKHEYLLLNVDGVRILSSSELDHIHGGYGKACDWMYEAGEAIGEWLAGDDDDC